MILDTLKNAARYADLQTGFSEAFSFLGQPGIQEMPEGKYEIAGDRVYALIDRKPGRKVTEGKLEGHRKYIDIQFVISGDESMGWSPRRRLAATVAYDEATDLEFFEGSPECIVQVPPGCFALFLPSDIHLPLIGNGPIHKVVVKVAVDRD